MGVAHEHVFYTTTRPQNEVYMVSLLKSKVRLRSQELRLRSQELENLVVKCKY